MLITEKNPSVTKLGTYRFFKIEYNNKRIDITVFCSAKNKDHDYICVLVNNAIQKAFRSLGKTFDTFEKALNHYKSADMRAVINAVRSEHLQPITSAYSA